MIDEFLLRALLVGLMVAAAAGPLGCFVLWRRMVYLGDTLGHASLLGVALATVLAVHPLLGVLAASLVLAVALFALEARLGVAADSALGILAHGSLAIGLLIVSLALGPTQQGVLVGVLFGDILAVGWSDVAIVAVALAAVALLLWRYWRAMLAAVAAPDVATAEGLPVAKLQLLQSVLLAVVIAVAIRSVGALLIGGLLVIPAASAAALARTPERMALLAALLGCLAVVAGLEVSSQLDVPTGPAIVVGALVLFGLAKAVRRRPV